MRKPDSQQRGLAGEYYVASILSRLGYDIGITIGRAKVLDMVAVGYGGKTINIQVKSTYYYDWLVSHQFDNSLTSVIALVRFYEDATQKPELYFVPGQEANKVIKDIYPTHSPRINRSVVMKKYKDHDFHMITALLDE